MGERVWEASEVWTRRVWWKPWTWRRRLVGYEGGALYVAVDQIYERELRDDGWWHRTDGGPWVPLTFDEGADE